MDQLRNGGDEMVSQYDSGNTNDRELVYIETEDFTFVIKGKPFHPKFEGLQQYRSLYHEDEAMEFHVDGEGIKTILIYDVDEDKLVNSRTDHRPIFFENTVYQIIVTEKGDKSLSFHHEHPSISNAISRTKTGEVYSLIGNLQFMNEVGLSTLQIQHESKPLLEMTMELFPTKINYRKDYYRLLQEVNDEIYNLAFHFLKKTFLKAKINTEGNPSATEFFRLIAAHCQAFVKALERIEKQPHHQLIKTYEMTRGDRLKQIDARGRSYIRKHPELFVEVNKGIAINSKHYLPSKGLQVNKSLTYDTLENRFIKWMSQRVIHKLTDLLSKVETGNKILLEENLYLREKIQGMIKSIEGKINNTFWQQVGTSDRSVLSLVMQMAPGYRDVFQIYLILSKGLSLQGNLYKMSVKDIATMYEYWTFLRIGKILRERYHHVEQDILKVNRQGLFVTLGPNQKASWKFKHPTTEEEILLTYQRQAKTPTTIQIPDTMLSIEKKGKDYFFHYIFDAKYRVDFAVKDTAYSHSYGLPGPLEEDINTMHRYRDSHVARGNGFYERMAVGAYVLFPWTDEETFQHHRFYNSINDVNIGGLPFLPNATKLVEKFIENLVEKSPEEIHTEGILPVGSLEQWEFNKEEKVLIGVVSTQPELDHFRRNKVYSLNTNKLRNGWQYAHYVGLYINKNVQPEEYGVVYIGEISSVEVIKGKVNFHVQFWANLSEPIKPAGYGIANYIMSTKEEIEAAKELPELFMKTKEEKTLWRMLRRISNRIKLDLDNEVLDEASEIVKYQIRDVYLIVDKTKAVLYLERGENKEITSLFKLLQQPSGVFKLVVGMLTENK